MSDYTSTPDVLVVGGGPIGLAIAFRVQQRGATVQVIDAGDGGAWRAAAGMLAPATEAEFGESELLELTLRSAALYPDFAAEIGECGYRRAGTVVVARDGDEAAELDRLLAFRKELGLEVQRLRPSEARRAEPALAPTVRLALDVPGDHSVDPRALVEALAQQVPVTKARVERLDDLRAGQIVVAAGAWSSALGDLPLRPVKGQALRLRDPGGPGLVERTVRTREAYLVPRGDGRYVLGATMEEKGWDTTPTAGAVFELVRDASEVVPGVLEMEIEEVAVGLRPTTPDNLPLIGERDGIIWATGHGRNGILLAPLTADLIADLLGGAELPDYARPCDPARFAEALV